MHDHPDLPPDLEQQIIEMLRHATRLARKGYAAQKFIAELAGELPRLAQTFFPPSVPDSDTHRITTFIARRIWDVMPWPANRFQPQPLPPIGRNDFCPCGSGKKYKTCCRELEHVLPEFNREMLLSPLLEQFTAKQLKALSVEELDAFTRVVVAGDWHGQQNYEKACILLEPLFKGKIGKGPYIEDAFDLLMDCYLALNQPDRRQRILDIALASQNTALRIAALQRKSTILADSGNFHEAWRLFKTVQRDAPDDPSLAFLELSLLMGEGKTLMASERARFWLAKFRRQPKKMALEQLNFLQAIVDDPEAVFRELYSGETDELQRLEQFIEYAVKQKPENLYSVQPGPQAVDGILDARPALHKLEAQWTHVSPLGEPLLTQRHALDDFDPWEPTIVDRWIGFLEQHPEARNSFVVLDDIVRALSHHPQAQTVPWLHRYALPLLEWSFQLLEFVRQSNRAMLKNLTWMSMDNRSALRLAAEYALALIRAGEHDKACTVMELLVYQLNPNDNQGMRDLLAESYLRAGRFGDMLKLEARYPDDGPDLMYGKALALYSQQQYAEAAQALHDAKTAWPMVFKYLSGKKTRVPKIHPDYVRLGGEDQAWLYLDRMREYWSRPEIQDWLKTGHPIKHPDLFDLNE